MQKKALYAIIVIAIIIVAAVAVYWVVTRKPEEHFEKVVENGDFISVDYIGYIGWLNTTDGKREVFDTSLRYVAEDNMNYTKNNTFEFRDNYAPLNFTVGSGQMIEGFDNGVLGMKVGDTKKVTVHPWEGYGNWSWDNVENISVEENISKFEIVKKSDFELLTGENATEGVTFTHWIWMWNATVDSVDDDNVTIENLRGQPAQNMGYEGLTVQSTKYDWNSTVTFINSTVIKVRHNPVVGMNVSVLGGERVITLTNGRTNSGKVMNVTNDTIVVDLNHKLAGKTLDFEITVLSIEAKE